MKINSMAVINYGTPTGTLEVSSDNTKTNITLTEHDAQQVMYLAERIYEQHQQRIAEEFTRPLPALGHFTEVEDENV